MAHDADAAGGRKQSPRNDDHDRIKCHFSRKSTSEQKESYKALGSTTSKANFRKDWYDKHVANVKGVCAATVSEVKTETQEGWYKNYAMIVQDKGGLIDLVSAREAADNICED